MKGVKGVKRAKENHSAFLDGRRRAEGTKTNAGQNEIFKPSGVSSTDPRVSVFSFSSLRALHAFM
jgi:hypothetical protein